MNPNGQSNTSPGRGKEPQHPNIKQERDKEPQHPNTSQERDKEPQQYQQPRYTGYGPQTQYNPTQPQQYQPQQFQPQQYQPPQFPTQQYQPQQYPTQQYQPQPYQPQQYPTQQYQPQQYQPPHYGGYASPYCNPVPYNPPQSGPHDPPPQPPNHPQDKNPEPKKADHKKPTDHEKPEKWSDYRGGVRIYNKAKVNYSLTIHGGKVILAPARPSDHHQHWIIDLKHSTTVRDESGHQSFSLVNRATGQALKHSIGVSFPVQLAHYNHHHSPVEPYRSVLWSFSENHGEGYRSIRAVNNIHLTLSGKHGTKKNGDSHDGTKIVMYNWKKQDASQLWAIGPYN
ncbi:uncharacterized protein [Rutidosis leptorrhynchoides]|uniref:uncharacterized protein n=1 Tax=Rutidosis leptorrhynchoides TaxID=125765 RepID=UPI003A997CD4